MFFQLDNGVPERAMMPPPSSGRGGGRGGGGRGMKAKNGATPGVSSGRGRGRGRGRGSLNIPGGSQASPKGNVLQMSPQHPGLFTEEKQGMIKSILFKRIRRDLFVSE